MTDPPVEIMLSNISSELLRVLSGNDDDELFRTLREKADAIGQNKKKLLELEDWLMNMISQASAKGSSFGKILYPEISQYARNIKSNVDMGNWNHYNIYKGAQCQSGMPIVGIKTNNINECIVDDSLNNVVDYKTSGSSPENIAMQINNKIARFQNLFIKFARKANKDFQITPVHESASNDLCVYGRIWCESEIQINEHNILIEGDYSNSKGKIAQVRNIENMPCICLFPGQMVAIKGNAIQDDFSFRYMASNIYTGIPAERPLLHRPKETSLMYGGENVHIMVVRSLLITENGDKVDFNGVFKKIKDEAPHLVIFMGPFVSARIISFQSQNFKELGDLISIYYKFIEEINTLSLHSNTKNTKFVLISHSYDLCSTHPLPQPPLNSKSTALANLITSDNLIYLPNPGYLRVNEVIIGITSCDPITSISRNMVCRPEDKALNLICQQLLQQRSFFPNYPSSKLPSEYAIEVNKLRHLEFPSQYLPHLYLFSSNYKKDPFVEIVSERCFVSVFSQSQDSWSDSKTCSVASIFILPPKIVDDNNEETSLLLSDRLIVEAGLFVK
ncbi:DNA polymerase alpha subunit B [Babesia microti strain RI]|uniref:DNA polymerase alpha subunit B n=1 Tax=Babesia microti (strain RI) TaxID=1133968 RepID=I7I9M8_BABMR|nr:DNA polymerase alpha subunit B [Babesia microti strain RI]CCF75314.2 DNA polymerase alpha subunit B [Babesia microti strain RI]|eukprot:XP_021337175.1 DNA polymerase alpha subunit B [Babesia microti strain RI]